MSAVHGVAKSRTRLSDWTELTDTGVPMAAMCKMACRGRNGDKGTKEEALKSPRKR